MTTLELITAVRSILDDENTPYKWADSAVIRYLNEAEEQACRRAYLLIDGKTASVCAFTVSVSVASFMLHSKVLQIKRMEVGSTVIPLKQKTRDELDELVTGWVSLTGVPDTFIHEANNEVILAPIAQSLTSANMIVARLPLNSFSTGSAEAPEIPAEYHNDLVDWALKRAYERRDPDTQDLRLSQFYESRFTVRFGPLPTAKVERLRKSAPRNMSARVREFGAQ
jgi:hypothetical protein